MAKAKTGITEVVEAQPPQQAQRTEIQVHQPVEQSTLMLFEGNPVKALMAAESLVQHMAAKWAHLVMDMRGKKYPLVEWWTTVVGTVEARNTIMNK